jgi:type IV pilus assembly protein PilP
MHGLRMSVKHLDWRQPWGWPRTLQPLWFVGAAVLGMALLSPWWLHSWQMWDEVQVAQTKLLAQQDATQTLREQTSQLRHTHNQPQFMLADTARLTQLAHQQGLQLSQLGQDKPQQSPALHALHLQQLPVHLKVQGAWNGWLNWLAQWPIAAPGVTVASLELKADPRGGISAQMLAVVPQSTATESPLELSSVNLAGASASDPFNAQAWASAQRAQAEQHPSYTRWVVPELLRPREVLEAFPRERLQYVGHMAFGTELEALIKVLPPAGTKKEAQMMHVYRVRLGQRLGQAFGQVLAVHPDQLVLQELAMTATGEWHPREVRLPLQEAVP